MWLGHAAVPKYVLAGLIQFLEIVTIPGTPGDRIDNNPELQLGPQRLVVWIVLVLLTNPLTMHKVEDLDNVYTNMMTMTEKDLN